MTQKFRVFFASALASALMAEVCPASVWWHQTTRCPAFRAVNGRSTNVETPPPFVKYETFMEEQPLCDAEKAVLERMKLTLFPDPENYRADNLGADYTIWQAEVDLFFDLHGGEPAVRKWIHDFVVYYSAHPPGGRFPGALHDGAHPVKDWRDFFKVPLDTTGVADAGDLLVKHVWYNLKMNLDVATTLAENGNFIPKRDKDRMVGNRPYTQRDAAHETEVFLRRSYLRFKLLDMARYEALPPEPVTLPNPQASAPN